jgi:Uncharacterized protein conserved in bacteria (DUF2312)
MSGPGGVAGDQLRSFVERIEHVDEEIKALTEDKKDVLMSRSCARSSGSERRTRRSEMRRSLCSTSTFKHWRPHRHQSRRRRDQSSQGGLGRPFFLRPARNSGLPILIAFARRELLGRANVWLEPPASHLQLGGISLTGPG